MPFYKLFAFADSFDFLLMILGTLGSTGNGLRFPIMTILVDAFGENQTDSNVADKVSPHGCFSVLTRYSRVDFLVITVW